MNLQVKRCLIKRLVGALHWKGPLRKHSIQVSDSHYQIHSSQHLHENQALAASTPSLQVETPVSLCHSADHHTPPSIHTHPLTKNKLYNVLPSAGLAVRILYLQEASPVLRGFT